MPPRDCLASLKLPTVCGVLPRSSHSPLTACFARLFSAPSFAELAKNASSRYQLYISRSNDPFLNLSVEHYLLQKSHIDSTILFLYIDRPCVVIGRNQNPWLEVDLRLLNGCSTGLRRRTPDEKAHRQVLDQVDLVRRRSGGGTVFHDHGNINYSVICPTPDFTRDKHAEMVVQAIRRVNPRARVNERHDIVLDQGEMLPESLRPDPRDLHKTAYTGGASTNPALKVSGSAYKLTRNRSLHHGTCLIQSPNLDVIPKYLRSPARAFMKARGVDSVRSPISNIAGDNKYMGQSKVFGFLRNILEAFTALYGLDQEILASFTQEGDDSVVVQGRNWVCAYVQDEAAEVPEIRAGMEELKSPDWIYGQTPQFTLSTYPIEEDERPRPSLPPGIPASARAYVKARSGIITSTQLSFSANQATASTEARKFDDLLKGRSIHQIADFHELLQQVDGFDHLEGSSSFSAWLNAMFGKVVH
ncbi:Biotin/lipoate A/B protein ligase [Lignoscripta atroalba]|nr:Biotin/lipoate A/B protein ligase [Lignoscripta atroalba]